MFSVIRQYVSRGDESVIRFPANVFKYFDTDRQVLRMVSLPPYHDQASKEPTEPDILQMRQTIGMDKVSSCFTIGRI